jgi:hypothetical protein
MDKKEPIPTDDVKVRVEDDVEEPVNTETQDEAEDTAKNEPSKPSSQEGKRSAGHVIADLGNEKKTIAASLIRLAKSSETARMEAKKLLADDPGMASYVKSKFGDDYTQIIGDRPIAKDDKLDLEKIREEERVKAQAEVIKEQMQSNKDAMVMKKAKELGLTTDEFEQFKRKFEILGGDEKALSDAALLVNAQKAKAKDTFEGVPSGGEAEKPVEREITITRNLNAFAEDRGMNKQKFAGDLDRVKSMHKMDDYGKPVMVLPGLNN